MAEQPFRGVAGSPPPVVVPDWVVPARVRALVTTRQGGVSQPPYDSLNLGDHVGDAAQDVAANRRRLQEILPADAHIRWLRQVHGNRVVHWREAQSAEADASWSDAPGEVCAVLTADCLPVLIAARDGSCVGVAHAGWRGLLAGVIEATVTALPTGGEQLVAWLGPAIGPLSFEVGEEVRDGFLRAASVGEQAAVREAFNPVENAPGKFMADLYRLARQRLARSGVSEVGGGQFCTANDRRFYSYRRDGETGRFASLIWLQPD